jgi:hypothetical protein
MVIGATGEDSGIPGDPNDNSARGSGAVYIYTRDSAGVWRQTAYLKAYNADEADTFGSSVALSTDGRTLAVGADYESSGNPNDPSDNTIIRAGAVYVYTQNDDNTWGTPEYIKADAVDIGDIFGVDLALSGDGNTLAVGVSGDDSHTDRPTDEGYPDSGAVYIFTRNGSGLWNSSAFIKAHNREVEDHFGASLALSADGNTLAVGATGEDSGFPDNPADNSVPFTGAVYLYTLDNSGVWGPPIYVKAASTDYFGAGVSLSTDGGILAVGSPFEQGDIPYDSNDETDYGWDADDYGPGAVYLY